MKNKTVLDIAREAQPEFIKEWQPFEKVYRLVKAKILRHFMKRVYQWQPTHEAASKRPFTPYTFTNIDSALGLAYTSTGSYAGLWICNSGYLWADDTHYFMGFAVDVHDNIYAIAHDYDENEIFIRL